MIYGATRKTAVEIQTLLESRHVDQSLSQPSFDSVRGKDTMLVRLDEDLVSPPSLTAPFTKAWGKVLKYYPEYGKTGETAGRILIYNPWFDCSYIKTSIITAQRSSGNILFPMDPTGRIGIFETVTEFSTSYVAQCKPSLTSGLVLNGQGNGTGYNIVDHLGIFFTAPVGTKLLAQVPAKRVD
jgi:hypothetical protein